jgi:hypothetical protein
MLRLIMFLCFLFVFSIPTAKAQNADVVDLSQKLSLEITTDKLIYNVNEPIKLTLSFNNSNNIAFVGTFMVTSLAPNVKIYYQETGHDFEAYNFTHIHGVYGPSEIPQNTKQTLNTVTLLYDTKKQKFAFERPGEYELKAIYENIDEENPLLQLESNVVKIQILALEGEENALKFFSDEFLARLIQGEGFFDAGVADYQKAIDRAIFLAEQYPNSFYTKILVNTKLEELHRKLKSSSLKNSEKALYEVLKVHDAGGLLQEKKNDSGLNLDQKTLDYLLKKTAKEPAGERDKPNR